MHHLWQSCVNKGFVIVDPRDRGGFKTCMTRLFCLNEAERNGN